MKTRDFMFDSPAQYDDREELGETDRVSAVPGVDVEILLAWLLKGKYLIALLTILGVVVAVGYIATAKPRYTAYTDIMIPPTNPQVVPNELSPPSLQSDSQLLDIESKLLLLTSGNVLRSVVQELDLKDVPEFNGREGGFNFNWRALLGSSGPPADDTLTAMRTLGTRIKVERQQKSYLASVGVWARNSDMAVRVSEALFRAFNEELAEAQADIAGSASSALSGRLEELKNAATEAASKVAAFRQANNLQTTAGELVSAQSMTQINLKLIDAKSRFLEAQSRYQQLTARKADGISPTSSLQSPTLTQLRAQYSTLKQRHDQLSITYGSRYPELITATQQLTSLREEIASEIDRVLQAAKVDMDQARLVMDDLAKQVATARGNVSVDNDAQVALDDLDRDLKAKTLLYETFLKRAGETGEQERLNVSNMRIVSAPLPAERRNWPPPLSVMAVGGAAGGFALGVALTLSIGFLSAFLSNRRQMIG